MIISASRRTDIPRFYAAWLRQRLRAGFCMVPNPFNPTQVSRVDLCPTAVTALVFWTRYPEPLWPFLQEIEESGYYYYFQITLNNYPRMYETNRVDLALVLKSVEKLAHRIGPQRLVWRYDPIFFADGLSESFHLENLAMLCRQLAGCTDTLVISLIDEYRKTRTHFRQLNCHYDGDPLLTPRLRPFLSELASIASTHHLRVTSCAEPVNWSDLGIEPAHCIDTVLIEKMRGTRLEYKKDPSQRKLCGCAVSKDIGMNQSCTGGCIYCYAVSRHDQALKNYQRHDPCGESLII